jgi:hypothetical protein
VTFGEASGIFQEERNRSYNPFSIRANAAKSAWFQEGN